ncbi:pantoate--beta-alanine ligase [Meridianimarinicoccus roseus]|uniref:Pantothenate synthetase n=1 Tax=Meridianimarinicoccus roseus TaxID=2072018 RepID=A0A2V2LFX9_9RHOB|nr:pantoate--beta-alanine ligase [Meridianimarinicoccus roseus]PWR01319.1 pantoate--beta-alanine ligase [Meridianimarinicoccus roseus]
MDICRTKAQMRRALAPLRGGGATLGLVPTMGYLHDGHLALVRSAREACDHVAASIFVNPTQFGPTEDLASYPRDAERDLALLEAEGVAAVFLPDPAEMYHPDSETVVDTTHLSGILIGTLRPGHFRGVATVVTKLFNIVQPTHAFFGRKDFQQLAVIRTMVRDLDIPVEIVGIPTQRAPDGLALSSRNVRLSPEHRAAAPALFAALHWAETTLPRNPMTIEELQAAITTRLSGTPGAAVQSVDIRDADTLAALTGPIAAPVVILLAVRFGDVLLIDQRVVSP